MKILIIHSVPLNGGDEALLRATIESLQHRWPESAVTVLCNNVELARQRLPDVHLEPDLECIDDAKEWARVGKFFEEADVVLSAPGGFLHDFYPLHDRLRSLEIALDLGKPVVLFAQSIGPFWKADSLRRIPQVFNRLAGICVRDAYSKECLGKLGVSAARVEQTADAAFLWSVLAPELYQPKCGQAKSVGLCFRAWPPGKNDGAAITVKKAVQLCRRLLAEPERELVFLSTCQGIDGYTDDSVLAQQIVGELAAELQMRCRIDRARYAPRELIREFSKLDAFIGMRLHGCLLSMLGGTAAMGLGYEQKTAEIFQQLGLDAYQLSFESPAQEWIAHADKFLQDMETIRAALPSALEKCSVRATRNLDVVAEVSKLDTATTTFPPFSTAQDRVLALIPPDAKFILVDEDQWRGSEWKCERAIPFLERAGEYWGAPANDAEAIDELERLRASGAEFIAFVEPALWWLEHYFEFSKFLQKRFRPIHNDEGAILFDLRNGK